MKSNQKITPVDVQTRKYSTFSICNSTLILIVSMMLGSCKKDLETTPSYPVNETFELELISKGIPADFAHFFAGATLKTSKPNDTTCIYLQTFPNGASREMTLRVSMNLRYTPTLYEVLNTNSGSTPIYAFKYTANFQADGTNRIELNYLVGKTAVPKGLLLLKSAPDINSTDVTGISWSEVWNKGLDWTIGSYIDYSKDMGIKAEPLGSLYALASALSDVAGAMDLSKQNKAWLNELDALEQCASHPTNPLALKDPAYSAAAVAKVQAARSELKEVNSVRFLNMMTETGAGINPVTSALSVGMKPAFLWNDQTLNNVSENTILREARLTVISCSDPDQTFPLELNGTVDLSVESTELAGFRISEKSVEHTLTNVKWVAFGEGYQVQEGSGSLSHEETSSTYYPDGKICTKKVTSVGSFEIFGMIMLINTPSVIDLAGYSVSAFGSATGITHKSFCDGFTFDSEENIDWLPLIKGFQGNDGTWEGVMFDTTHVTTSLTVITKVKWNFSLPPVE